VYVEDENGEKIMERNVQQTVEGLAEFGRWLDEKRAEGIELWAAIEKPHGRIVDFVLNHGVVVYPVNPKALDRARDRFRMSPSKSDGFDAYVLAEFVGGFRNSVCEAYLRKEDGYAKGWRGRESGEGRPCKHQGGIIG
jgi:hypothetical protein